MATVQIQDKTYTQKDAVASIMADHGLFYEKWHLKEVDLKDANECLKVYEQDITRLKERFGYLSEDAVALSSETKNLDQILEDFSKKHHHIDDEVRFTIAGEGVFEIQSQTHPQIMVRFCAQAGDLIIIPAYVKHLFYLTDQRYIRCLRIFKDASGWKAYY